MEEVMSLEVRPITSEEVERAEFITAYSFNSPERRDLARAVERARKFYAAEWSLASFENGEMTAFIRVLPFAMRINGRGLSFGAVGPVVSSPEHRRKGHVGVLLRRALADMRERGQVLSGLHTPHPTLYRRYGWEIASLRRQYAFAPKDIALKAQPGERGRFRMLQPDDWSQADRVYRLHSAQRNGPLHRGEVWWREAVFGVSGPVPSDVALWENGQGEPQGYVVYHQPTRPDFEPPAFWVRELVALSSDAYLNLILYVLRHDLPREITWGAAVDDPFLTLVDDATKVKVTEEYDLLLRLCDVEGALKLRTPAYAGHSLALTLEVTDSSAPWNEGVWRIEVGEDGTVRVERASDEADVTLSATTLAPLYNGFLSPSAAALAGLVSARTEEALTRADALFATLYPPFCADGF
jgi:predicted acetyltransferase